MNIELISNFRMQIACMFLSILSTGDPTQRIHLISIYNVNAYFFVCLFVAMMQQPLTEDNIVGVWANIKRKLLRFLEYR